MWKTTPVWSVRLKKSINQSLLPLPHCRNNNTCSFRSGFKRIAPMGGSSPVCTPLQTSREGEQDADDPGSNLNPHNQKNPAKGFNLLHRLFGTFSGGESLFFRLLLKNSSLSSNLICGSSRKGRISVTAIC